MMVTNRPQEVAWFAKGPKTTGREWQDWWFCWQMWQSWGLQTLPKHAYQIADHQIFFSSILRGISSFYILDSHDDEFEKNDWGTTSLKWKTPTVTMIYGYCWREIWKIQHNWKGLPHQNRGGGNCTLHEVTVFREQRLLASWFSGSLGFLAAALLGKQKSYLVPSKEERIRYR